MSRYVLSSGHSMSAVLLHVHLVPTDGTRKRSAFRTTVLYYDQKGGKSARSDRNWLNNWWTTAENSGFSFVAAEFSFGDLTRTFFFNFRIRSFRSELGNDISNVSPKTKHVTICGRLLFRIKHLFNREYITPQPKRSLAVI